LLDGLASGDPDAPGAPFASAALENARVLAAKGQAGLLFCPGTWGGYPWGHEALCDLSPMGGARDLVLLA